MTDNNLDNKDVKDIKKIMSKIEKVFQEKQGFSKLSLFSDPVSESNFESMDPNIFSTSYESSRINENLNTNNSDNMIEGFENPGSSILEQLFKPIKNPKDIADHYLNNELKEQKLSKDDRDPDEMKNSKKNKYCEATFYMGQVVQLRSEVKNETPTYYKISKNDIKKRKADITQLPPLENDEDDAPIKTNINYDDITPASVSFEFTSIPKYIYSLFIYLNYGIQKTVVYSAEVLSTDFTQTESMSEEEEEAFKKTLKEDQQILIDNVYKIFNILMIIFITYNWFFVFFYKDENNNIIKYCEFNPEDVNKRGDVARFFLEFGYFPFCVFTTFFIYKEPGLLSFPNMSNFIESNVVLFIGLFSLIYFNFEKLSYFVTKLTNGRDTSYIIYFLTLFGIFAGTSESNEEWNKTLEFYNKYYIGFLVWIFRAIIALFMLPYVNITIGFYLLYSSFFSIFHDTYITKKASNVFNNITNMLNINTKTSDECDFDDDCMTTYESFKRICKQIYNMFINNFSFVIVITIILSSFNEFFSIKNETLRISSIFSLVFMVFLTIVLNISNPSASGANDIANDGMKIGSSLYYTFISPILNILSMIMSLPSRLRSTSAY